MCFTRASQSAPWSQGKEKIGEAFGCVRIGGVTRMGMTRIIKQNDEAAVGSLIRSPIIIQ